MARKQKLNIIFYVILTANILPVIPVLAGALDFWKIAYFYWAECALVAILTLAFYAKYLIVFMIMLAAIGLIVYMANPDLLANQTELAVFWSLYALCVLGYVEFGKSAYGRKMKRLSPYEQLGIYSGFMGASILVCFWLASFITEGWPSFTETPTFYKAFIGMAIIVPSISIGLVRVIDMIGQKHFIDFVLGTYHQPQERNSLVLFLDMVGSSGMAEKLEAKKSMNLIAQFIYDCGYIFRINGGDILNYTGDGLVVLWPRNQSNSALAAIHSLRLHFASKEVKTRYWKKYGIVPDFRIGLHAGPVVISQIGEEKLFLGLYGDVVNTSARLEQLNKDLGTKVLMSAEAIMGLNQSWRSLLKPLGERKVRGREEKVSVYTLYDK